MKVLIKNVISKVIGVCQEPVCGMGNGPITLTGFFNGKGIPHRPMKGIWGWEQVIQVLWLFWKTTKICANIKMGCGSHTYRFLFWMHWIAQWLLLHFDMDHCDTFHTSFSVDYSIGVMNHSRKGLKVGFRGAPVLWPRNNLLLWTLPSQSVSCRNKWYSGDLILVITINITVGCEKVVLWSKVWTHMQSLQRLCSFPQLGNFISMKCWISKAVVLWFSGMQASQMKD